MKKRVMLASAVFLAFAAIATIGFSSTQRSDLRAVSLLEADAVAGGAHGPCGGYASYGEWCTSGYQWCTWWYSYCSEYSTKADGSGTYYVQESYVCYGGCADVCDGGVYDTTTCPTY